MEQHNWTLLTACKIRKKDAQSLMQTISNSFHMVGQMMNKNTSSCSANYTHRFAILVHKCHSSDLIFKNNAVRKIVSAKLWWHHFQRQPPDLFYKKSVLKNFAKFTGKHLCRSLLIAKETLTQVFFCFSVNLPKFLRTPFLQNISGRLLLYFIGGRKICSPL